MGKKEYNSIEAAPAAPAPGYTRLEGVLSYVEVSLVGKKVVGKDASGAPIIDPFFTSSNKKTVPVPETVTPTQLDLLIDNYVYQYIDSPKKVPIHNRQLLAALLELKERRERQVPDHAE